MKIAFIMVLCCTLLGATVGAVAVGFGSTIALTPLHKAQL